MPPDRTPVKQLALGGKGDQQPKNRFKFRSFAQVVKDLRIDVVHKVRKADSGSDPADGASFFCSALTHWTGLNGTADFSRFVKTVRPLAQSLPQILHHQSAIVRLLAEHLQVPDTLAYEPLLCLCTELARDLQDEFYPDHYHAVLEGLLPLVNRPDAHVLEATFKTIAHLFKTLSRLIVQDPLPTLHLMAPVLANKTPHIRSFAAEAFGFLLRRVPLGENKLETVLQALWDLLRTESAHIELADDEMVDGESIPVPVFQDVPAEVEDIESEFAKDEVSHTVIANAVRPLVAGAATLILESMTHVRGILHSRASGLLGSLLDLSLGPGNGFGNSLDDPLFLMLQAVVNGIVHHLNKESSMTVLSLVLDKTEEYLKDSSGDAPRVSIVKLAVLLNILASCRRGTFLKDKKRVYALSISLLSASSSLPEPTWRYPLLKFVTLALYSSSATSLFTEGKGLIQSIFNQEDVTATIYICTALQTLTWDPFATVLLPHLVPFARRHWISHSKDIIQLLDLLFQNSSSLISTISSVYVATPGLIRLHALDTSSQQAALLDDLLVSTLKQDFDWSHELSLTINQESTNLATVASICMALMSVDVSRLDDFLPTLQAMFNSLLDAYLSQMALEPVSGTLVRGEPKHILGCLLGKVLETLVVVSGRIIKKTTASLIDILDPIMSDLLPACDDNARLLEGIAAFLEELSGQELLTDQWRAAYEPLKYLLHSQDTALRTSCLRILTACEKTEKDSIFRLLLDIESTPNSVATIRGKVILMKRLEMVLASSIDQIQMDIALRYLVGLFTVDFTPLWEQGRQTLMLLVSKHLDKFWDIIFPLLGSSFNIEEVSQRVLLDAGSENGTTFSLKWECPLTFERHIQKMTSASYQAVFGRELSSLFGFAKSLKTVVMPLNCKSYFQQLLGLLEQLPSLIERKSDELVPLFFALTEKGEMDVETSSVLSGSLRRSHLLAFLKVFSKVKHPKKLHESEKLYSIFSELLANGEHKIQALALDCVLTWKEPTIIAHVDQLKDLTQDEKYSDAMLSLDIPGLYSSYTPEGRAPFMKVFLQILYGKLISRSGRGSSTHGLKSRRKAIFGFIATLSETDIAYIIDFMLDPYIGAPRGEEGSRNVDRRHRLGFLNLLEDAIAQLKTKITPFLPLILRAILLVPQLDIDEDEEEEGHDDDQEEGDVQKSSKDRQIYSLCIHRIKEIFSLDVSLDYTPFIQDIFKIFINDRIAKLHTENTQAPSALLQLFLAWSRNPAYATLLVSQSTVLFSNIIALVSAKKANESVVSLSLTIIENIQDILDAETEAGEEHSQESRLAVELKSMFPSVIDHISLLFSGYLSNGVSITLGRGQEIQLQAIRILSGGIKLVGQSENAVKIIRILFPLVKKPEKQVSEKIKEDILKIFVKFLHIIPEIQEDLIRSSYYGTVSQLYSNMMSRKARSQLQDVFFHFQQRVPSLKTTYDVLGDLNSFNQRRIDEPDFQRQFLAFGKLIDNQSDALSPDHWLPIVHNLLYLIQNTEEFASRNSSSHILQVLSQMAAKETLVRETTSRSFLDLIIHIVFPAIKKGLKNKSEVVRAELVTVLGVYVKNLPLHNSFRDMVPLLGGDNEEANFFMNIYHLQSHRRVRALRDLTAVCSQGLMASSLVSTVFIPILSHFVFESDRVAEHNFINEAIIGIRGCAAALSWGHYHALIRRFMNALEKRPDLERVLIRIIVQILDAFHFDVSSAALGEGYVASTVVNNDLSIISAKDEELNDEVDDTDAITPDRTGESEKISRVVTEKLLPSFVALLPEKDDEKVPARAPIALAIAKLLLNFPPKIHDQELARLLTKLCAILRSHLQDTRNSARDTLIQIAIMWGSKVTGQVICQLQSALRRDYQLHVLSYTLHSLITQVAPFLKVGDLDSVMANISSICIEDVFGASAQEKEVEALKGKMKEMKGTKSFDTLELISKMIGLGAVGKLLLPIREIMLETSDSKNIANMKEVFRRVAVGLSRNEGLLTKDVLTFIHELLTENLSLLRNDSLTGKKAESNQERTYKVRMKRAQVGDPMKNFSANSFLFVEFGLSIMLSILRSDNVSFKENNLLEMMAPFVEVLGTLLYSPHDSVTAQTMRVFCIIIKLPIDKMEGAVPVVLKRIFSIVRKSSTLETELLQVSFRLLTIIIRDCHSVDVTHKQLGVLLELIRPDLEQPDRQAVVFSMIKAILSRKLVLPEIYSLMDEVCRVMVTNQTDSIRSLCQQKFLQFILDYPHVEAKLQQQVNFVIKGLSYEHESGRITVLELLNDLLSHFSTEVLAKFSDIIFMALAMNLVNDDSAKCRELTSLVMRALFKKVSAEKLDKLMTLVDSWLESDAQPLLHRVSVQVYGLVIDSLNDSCKRHVDTMLRQLSKLLGAFLETYKAEEEEEESVQTLNWELGYYSLNSLSKLFTAFPEKMNQEDIWESVFALLPHPHSWIRNVACKLYGQLFSALDPVSRSFSTGKNGDAFGIVADEKKLKGLVSKFFVLLDSANLKPALAVQLIKNLIFISRCLLSLLPEILPVATEDDTDEPKDSQPGLLWLVKKMNRLARQESSRRRGPLIRQTVFQLFAATFPMVPSLYVSPCLEMMLETLYRVRNDETLKGEGMDDLKMLAQEVMEHLQKTAGHTPYMAVYNRVHARVQQVREERREGKKIRAIIDPEGLAKRKAQKNDMKRAGRKRKIDDRRQNRVRTTISKKARTSSAPS